MNDLKIKLKYYREKQNMSKSELARKIGVSPAYITKLENGEKTNPSISVLMRICTALGITSSDLQPSTEAFDVGSNLNRLAEKDIKTLNIGLVEDSSALLSIAEYKTNIDKYWKSVVEWYPLNKVVGVDFIKLADTELRNTEINEIANFLKTAFELKISEIKSRKK
jgi:transcriptional regulator with XRE-family HTH domain